MKYKPYPTYKDSGVEWLGKIPEGWKVLSLKYITKMKSGDFIEAERISDSGQFPVLGGNGLRGFAEKCNTEGRYPIIGRQGALCGNINFANGQFWATEHAIVAYPKQGTDPRWLYWTLGFLNLGQYNTSAAQPGISVDVINNIFSIHAPLPTQRAIASFLDTETARIDGLVKDYEELIALLKEKRQALISHMVTRGLSELVSPKDPEFGTWAKPVKFKDSGVEWIGEIPEGWEVPAIGYHYYIQLGKMLDAAQITGSQLYPFLRNQDVQWNSINLENLPEMDFSKSEMVKYSLRFGDLLVCEGGDVGRAAIWNIENTKYYYQKALHRLRPLFISRNDPLFLLYFFMMANGNGIFIGGEEKATIYHLTADRLRKFRFPYPQKQEQSAIAAFLDRETAKMDMLVNEAEAASELLKEHRSALITNAVTGKIDVEDLV